MRYPTDYRPEDCGSALTDGRFEYYWFDGSRSSLIEEISRDEEASNADDSDNENDDNVYCDGSEDESDDSGNEFLFLVQHQFLCKR
ncbi:unnamed protein product [Arctia plantaginis]|uniref:Uncharacterized protein n=1 Tax=Arctia plantaginis TaxID=874455 RepID=A0A8S0YUG7_ARCPL|nr:unnamed protein product [Arctia plantaginis]